jgi:hypothetical protein
MLPSTRWPCNSVTALATLAGFAGLAFGQAFTGSISGIVTDPSGAPVAGCAVVAMDLDRNTNYRTSSNASGVYVVPQLPPGRYRVSVEAPGFRRYVLDDLPLSTQQSATVNVTLQLGEITEQIQVTAQTQMVEAGSSALGSVIENKRIQDLPVPGRNIFQLTALLPGCSISGRRRRLRTDTTRETAS